jgi:hypothetical protein
MSGENIIVYADASRKVLESAGIAIASGSIAQADDAIYDMIVDGAGYPDAMFVFSGQFGTAPTENTVLAIYARPLDIDGTLDDEVPEATRPSVYIGSYSMNNVTSIQTKSLVAYDVPRKAEYYVHNVNTGQSLTAGWTLKVTPRSNKAAA